MELGSLTCVIGDEEIVEEIDTGEVLTWHEEKHSL